MDSRLKPLEDEAVNHVVRQYSDHPMMLALLDYGFPNLAPKERIERLVACHSIYDFQSTIIYPALKRVIKETTEDFTTEGFSKLDKSAAYLYISNHRDIVLDTCLTNMLLMEKQMNMTASAIGDNLVPTDFLLAFSKLNRNFLVQRSLAPRELLMSSIKLSNYIKVLIKEEKRSVWLAQREGRTKDGNDTTQQGVLKMLTLGDAKTTAIVDQLNQLNIVPLSISYEYDPTDYLKMPALLASYRNEEYVKTKNEDFNNIMTGMLGQKKRVHINAGLPINFEVVIDRNLPDNQQLQQAALHLTKLIHEQYHLWPSNYIAYDMVHKTNRFENQYTNEQKEEFMDRVAKKTLKEDDMMRTSFLNMYANPVLNKTKQFSSIID